MPPDPFPTKHIGISPDAIAPDGSEVRVLCATSRGSMAAFTLPPGAVTRAVAHHTVEEIWYVAAGSGRLWRQFGEREEIADLSPGISVAIPTGVHFQFRCEGDEPLSIVAATMPPWPGEAEAYPVAGKWEPTV